MLKSYQYLHMQTHIPVLTVNCASMSREGEFNQPHYSITFHPSSRSGLSSLSTYASLLTPNSPHYSLRLYPLISFPILQCTFVQPNSHSLKAVISTLPKKSHWFSEDIFSLATKVALLGISATLPICSWVQ